MALDQSEELCFSTDVFTEQDFHVDEFVSSCRKRVTIERLRDDLERYFRTLKAAMVDLINKDYADFVSLSSNLVGMEKSIGSVTEPLTQLQDEIMGIKSAMDATITATESRLQERAELREKKTTLRRLITILESVEKLERLLKISHRHTGSEIDLLSQKEDFASVVMERIATEFNKLQYNVSLTSSHPAVEDIKPRIAVITSSLQSKLEQSLSVGLETGDEEVLTRVLQTYSSISRQEAAESMFQSQVVRPYLDQVVSAKALLTHPQGLEGMFADILKLVPKHCSLLLELTQPPSAAGGSGSLAAPTVSGYDFLVNSVWPEVVSTLEQKASVIFAPGNPDTFHKNYSASTLFVSSFEGHCVSQLSVRRLRAHPSFTVFMSKWSLPVYFQIRFQEIAGLLESKLALPLLQAQEVVDGEVGVPLFRLELFQVLWRCLERCWSGGVFLDSLVHRFWKLTLQLVSRTATWLDELLCTDKAQSEEVNLSVPLCLSITHDCELLANEVVGFVERVVLTKPLLLKLRDILREGIKETTAVIQTLTPALASHINESISRECMRNLQSAHTIPRLYRRTNKEVPQKPSNYVRSILSPLARVKGDLPGMHSQQWTHSVVETVTEKYFDITSEVLTSVKRTEDSLLKLKRNRKSAVPASTGIMSDDNKIRLQLALDIEEYSIQVVSVDSSVVELKSYSELIQMGALAKTTALQLVQ